MKKIFGFTLTVAIIFVSIISMSSCMSAIDAIADAFNEASDGAGAGDRTGADNAGAGNEGAGSGTEETPDGSGSTSGTGSDVGGEEEGGAPSGGTDTDGGNGSTSGDGSSDSSIYLPEREENAALADSLTSLQRTLLSSVAIVSTFEVGTGYYASSETMFGSGVFYSVDRESGDAYIITNYHVVYSPNATKNSGISQNIMIYLYGQEYTDYAVSATYVGGSLNYDLAVLKITDSEVIRKSCAVAAKMGDSDGVHVFDDVVAVGNPEGYGISATEGIISVQSESLDMTGADGKTTVTFRVMRVSAAINSGNSGGGLYNEKGELIGIVNAKRQGANIDNIAYAIPINLAKNVAENIIDNCDGTTKVKVYKALLGIKISAKSMGVVIDPDSGDVVIESEVVVKEVLSNAIVIDQLIEGDVIRSVTVDGHTVEVTRDYHVTDTLLRARVGSVVVLNVTRGEEAHEITVVIPQSSITVVN